MEKAKRIEKSLRAMRVILNALQKDAGETLEATAAFSDVFANDGEANAFWKEQVDEADERALRIKWLVEAYIDFEKAVRSELRNASMKFWNA